MPMAQRRAPSIFRSCWPARFRSTSTSNRSCSRLCRSRNVCRQSSPTWKPSCPAYAAPPRRDGIDIEGSASEAAAFCSKGNHHDCFEGDRLPVFGGGTEFPARQSAFGKLVQTIVWTCEDANFSNCAVGMDDRVERNCALHIRAHQFDRIAGGGFLDRIRCAQFASSLARLEFGKTDHPTAG